MLIKLHIIIKSTCTFPGADLDGAHLVRAPSKCRNQCSKAMEIAYFDSKGSKKIWGASPRNP